MADYSADPGGMGGAAPPSGGEMHDPAMHEGGEDMGMLHVSPDMLPKGMKLNVGDLIEFKVTGPPDADGDWPIVYNTDEGGEAEHGKDDDKAWEDEMRHEMSPRSDDNTGEGGSY